MCNVLLHEPALTVRPDSSLFSGRRRPFPPSNCPPAGPSAAPELVVMRLTADDAVRLAAENNLGIQIDRFNPQIRDLSVAQAQGAGSRR